MNGILIVNKEKGFTSHDVVGKLRKILNTKKIGHTGTLDPNATGVLPILIGDATKISKYMVEHTKAYIATVVLGEKTTTGDVEGQIAEIKEVNKQLLTIDNIEKNLKTFLGRQKQIPPMYSSIKVNGKKLYEYARAGEKVEVPERDIDILDIRFINIKDEETNIPKITFYVECSKGTYIRTLCEDFAKKMQTVGYMSDLKRTKVDKFIIEKSMTLEEIEENKEKILEKLISIEEIFCEKEKIVLENKRMGHFINGVQLTFDKKDDIYRIYDENMNFIGIGIVKNKLLKRDVILDR